MSAPWMLYGATGYTGRLITAEARRRGLRPILAGRSAAALKTLADETGFEICCFDLNDTPGIVKNLHGVQTVLHCAGPFSATAEPMLNGCLKTGTNYLDITGEIPVFEMIQARHQEIAAAGISAIPGVGFDVVPTDCLAAILKARQPDAHFLRLGLKVRGGVSRGTAKTAIEMLGRGGCVRRDGRLVTVAHGYKTLQIPFESEPEAALTIPWGDVACAFYSTGIPNIEVFLQMPQRQIRMHQLARYFQPLLRLPAAQNFLKRRIERQPPGPDESRRAAGEMRLWGEVENRAGRKLSLRMKTPEGYNFTVQSALAAVEKMLTGPHPKGARTPSQAFGPGFAQELPGVSLDDSRS